MPSWRIGHVSPSGAFGKRQRPSPSSSVSPVKIASAFRHSLSGSAFRQIAWLASRLEIPLQVPAQHPFNPLPLLRLAWACPAAGGTPNRLAVEKIFRHVWRGAGADANEAGRLAALTQDLAPQQDPAGEAVKEQLRTATEQALAAGVFGVPTIAVDGRLFWGLDSLDMLAAYLRGDPWFDGPDWAAAALPRPGVRR